MDHLTKSQQKVYDFLRQQASTGVPPTVREICTATGLRSTSTVHAHLKALERLGYITREAGLKFSESSQLVFSKVLPEKGPRKKKRG